MPSSRRLARSALVLLAALLPTTAACYRDPTAELAAMQASLDLQDTLNELGMRTSDLQFAFDSLRSVVARQDSTIALLANLAGVSYRR